MNKKLKIIFGILGIGLVSVFVSVTFGLYLIAEEDRYGDLVYFYQKVEDGDIIFRSKDTGELRERMNFTEFGIIENSWGKVYVWDKQNTIQQDLYDWAKKGNGDHVKVFRVKKSGFDINNARLKNGTYNHLMSSDKIEFITEN